jgi:putative hydroxymethylpyrimidine transport system permease protein
VRRLIAPVLRSALIICGVILLWQVIVWLTGLPHYILPAPAMVAVAWWTHAGLILGHAGITIAEIALGLLFGTILGGLSALTLVYFRPARLWLLPLLVASQAVPVFALAPILVLWFGYGIASKVAMATLIIYFPVVASFYDGLRRTEPGWLDLARTMNGSRWRVLRYVRIPAALPSLGSGLRVAAAVAPIGAVVGEWVGASAGLGYLMLHANGRMQIALMFAALLTLAVFAIAIYFIIDIGMRRALPWQPDAMPMEREEPS